MVIVTGFMCWHFSVFIHSNDFLEKRSLNPTVWILISPSIPFFKELAISAVGQGVRTKGPDLPSIGGHNTEEIEVLFLRRGHSSKTGMKGARGISNRAARSRSNKRNRWSDKSVLWCWTMDEGTEKQHWPAVFFQSLPDRFSEYNVIRDLCATDFYLCPKSEASVKCFTYR